MPTLKNQPHRGFSLVSSSGARLSACPVCGAELEAPAADLEAELDRDARERAELAADLARAARMAARMGVSLPERLKLTHHGAIVCFSWPIGEALVSVTLTRDVFQRTCEEAESATSGAIFDELRRRFGIEMTIPPEDPS